MLDYSVDGKLVGYLKAVRGASGVNDLDWEEVISGKLCELLEEIDEVVYSQGVSPDELQVILLLDAMLNRPKGTWQTTSQYSTLAAAVSAAAGKSIKDLGIQK